MNTSTSWFDYWNRKVRKLTIVDLKLIQVASMAVILIVVKLFPEIISLSIWWFVALLIVCAVRPIYIFWIEEDDADQRSGAEGCATDNVAFLENSPAREGGAGREEVPRTPPSRAGLSTDARTGTLCSMNSGGLGAQTSVAHLNEQGAKEMDPLEQWLQLADRRVKQFSFFDVKLIQLCGAFFGIALVKLFPLILELGFWQLVGMALLCAAKPALIFFVGTDEQPERRGAAK